MKTSEQLSEQALWVKAVIVNGTVVDVGAADYVVLHHRLRFGTREQREHAGEILARTNVKQHSDTDFRAELLIDDPSFNTYEDALARNQQEITDVLAIYQAQE